MPEPSVLHAQFNRGELDRNEYWAQMREWHVVLRQYSKLIAAGDSVDAVELSAQGLVVRLRDGSQFWWEPEDFRTPPSVAVNNGSYEADLIKVLTELSAEARTVLDIGANIGWVCVQLGRRVAESGRRIFAFEPLPPTFERLKSNLALNNLDEIVTALNVGLGAAPDTVRFYMPEDTGSVAASRRKLDPAQDHRDYECRIETIDGVVAERTLDGVDLIKCDVEGAEIFALKGGRRVLETHRPVVVLEMLRKWAAVFGYHPNDIIEFMNSSGYQCFGIEKDRIERVDEVTDETTAANYLFLPSDAEHNPVARVAAEMVSTAR